MSIGYHAKPKKSVTIGDYQQWSDGEVPKPNQKIKVVGWWSIAITDFEFLKPLYLTNILSKPKRRAENCNIYWVNGKNSMRQHLAQFQIINTFKQIRMQSFNLFATFKLISRHFTTTSSIISTNLWEKILTIMMHENTFHQTRKNEVLRYSNKYIYFYWQKCASYHSLSPIIISEIFMCGNVIIFLLI